MQDDRDCAAAFIVRSGPPPQRRPERRAARPHGRRVRATRDFALWVNSATPSANQGGTRLRSASDRLQQALLEAVASRRVIT